MGLREHQGCVNNTMYSYNNKKTSNMVVDEDSPDLFKSLDVKYDYKKQN